MSDQFLEGPSFRMTRLTCKAFVNGESVAVTQVVAAEVWANPDAREAVKAAIRQQLAFRIVEKWKPKIAVHE